MSSSFLQTTVVDPWFQQRATFDERMTAGRTTETDSESDGRHSGSPSGTAATASATAVSSINPTGVPWMMPIGNSRRHSEGEQDQAPAQALNRTSNGVRSSRIEAVSAPIVRPPSRYPWR